MMNHIMFVAGVSSFTYWHKIVIGMGIFLHFSSHLLSLHVHIVYSQKTIRPVMIFAPLSALQLAHWLNIEAMKMNDQAGQFPLFCLGHYSERERLTPWLSQTYSLDYINFVCACVCMCVHEQNEADFWMSKSNGTYQDYTFKTSPLVLCVQQTVGTVEKQDNDWCSVTSWEKKDYGL